MLVLLIIFMVAAPLATVDLGVDLPASAVEPQPRPEQPVFVTVKPDLSIAVGEDVILDKDGSPMLNAVGLVDTGRISQDTGHSFDAAREAGVGIAARFYMHRNFFVDDPDAFNLCPQQFADVSELKPDLLVVPADGSAAPPAGPPRLVCSALLSVGNAQTSS